MTKTPDFTKVMQDAFAAFPMDTARFQDAFKSQAAFGEKISKVALEAAEKSAEISAKWTKDTLARLGDVTRAQTDVADYQKAASSFASATAEIAAENLAAFAEIAKKVQMETVELMLAAGKELQEDASSAMKKAGDDLTAAARKPSAAAK